MNVLGQQSITSRVRGFTLIELLVVVAIIGILSAVVLSSLTTARNKGTDTAIRSNLSNARSEAELYFNEHIADGVGFNGVCALTGTGTIGDNVRAAELAFDSTAVAAYTDTTNASRASDSSGQGACHDSAVGWAAQVPLKNNSDGNFFCVDHTGVSTTTNNTIPSTGIACP